MTSKSLYIQGKTSLWEVVIGLEVHAQVVSKSKMFSGSSTTFGATPNSQVSLVDAGFPGMLPILNEFCVEQAIKTGLGLNAQINEVSIFDRKNYFYADLPQGYQISQFYHPIVGKGHLDIDLKDEQTKRIGITRLHLEQDAGKSIHDQHPYKSYIDLNRCGVALMEIVTDPDMRSAEEAQAFVKKLRALLRCLGTCDGNMEQGSMRADVNVSLRRPDEPYGTRAEIKNVNSIRFIGQAINFEIKRQLEILEEGGCIDQETRLFDPSKNETRSMRSKENAQDYRYFPDPDLLPLKISKQQIEEIQKSLPELPDAKKARFMQDYGLSSYDAGVLTAEIEIAEFFEACLVQKSQNLETEKFAKTCANWIIGDFFAALNRESLIFDKAPVTVKDFSDLINLILQDIISGKIAKDVFLEMWESKQNPKDIVKNKGLEQINDDQEILMCIDQIMALNQDKVIEYRSGKDKLFGFFVGQVLKQMQGKANPQMVNDLLKKKLEQ